jgi:hypothetical protein
MAYLGCNVKNVVEDGEGDEDGEGGEVDCKRDVVSVRMNTVMICKQTCYHITACARASQALT